MRYKVRASLGGKKNWKNEWEKVCVWEHSCMTEKSLERTESLNEVW